MRSCRSEAGDAPVQREHSSRTTPNPSADGVLIRVSSVSKTFLSGGHRIPAVDDLSIEVSRGEFIALVGPSGCGKTTLMMIIGGLIDADSGEVEIHGDVVHGPFTNLGIVFQYPELLDWRTSLGNILLQIEIRGLPQREYEPVAHDLLHRVGLDGFADKYPHELSGGMKQRVALCRALVHDPEILLLDEPFGALDALTRDQMNFDLQRIWLEKRKTAILVTHSIDEAVWLSDRVLVVTPRPARIAQDISIDLPRPRSLELKQSEAFNAYTARVRELFKELGVFRDEK